MTFREEEVDTFLSVFNSAKEKIRAYPGCLHLELWRDKAAPNAYLTYSHWTGEAALENYRHSSLFKETWAKTKPLFSAPPKAFSSEKILTLD